MMIQRAFVRSKIKKIAQGQSVKKVKETLKKSSGRIANLAKNKGKLSKLNKLTKTDTKLTWAIRINVITFLIITIITIIALVSAILFVCNLAGISILGNNIIMEEEEEEKNWQWDLGGDSNLPNISGGIYPPDHDRRERAYLIEILTRSSEDVKAQRGMTIKPCWMLGVTFRENSNTIFNYIDDNQDKSIIQDLYVSSPACGKGPDCSWLKNGVSHFVGGSVVNGADTGDPYTQKVNTDKSLYEKYNTEGGHAIGIYQFEVPYVYDRCQYSFPVEDQFGVDVSNIPSRPNIFYMPDVTYSAFFGHADADIMSSEYYKDLENYSNFSKLSQENKDILIFTIAACAYGRGHARESDFSNAKIMADWAINNNNKYIGDLLKNDVAKLFNAETIRFGGSRPVAKSLMLKYVPEISSHSDEVFFDTALWAVLYGEAVWDTFVAKTYEGVEQGGMAAGGPWLDYIGSGKFKPTDSGKYYHEKLQTTVFHQTSGSDKYADADWGPTRDSDGSTLVKAGCGIYSTAYCITNLTGKVVTVKDLVNQGYFTSWPASEAPMIKAAKAYGLDAYELSSKNLTVDDKTLEDVLLRELKDGGLLINVYWGANKFKSGDYRLPPGIDKSYYTDNGEFEWYKGSSHYMVIRGYNNVNNKFRVYTSAGQDNMGTFDELSAIELPASRIRPFINTNYCVNYNFIVIKIKGGAAAIQGSGDNNNQGGTGATGDLGFRYPLSSKYYRITSLFGGRIHPVTGKPNNHLGIDISAPEGEPIYAAKDGTVEIANTNESKSSYGLYVKIKHPDGTSTLYAHMSKVGTTVNAQVKAGDIIGYVGSTGTSTGNHLHFEIKNSKGTRVDPVDQYPNIPLYILDGGKKYYL